VLTRIASRLTPVGQEECGITAARLVAHARSRPLSTATCRGHGHSSRWLARQAMVNETLSGASRLKLQQARKTRPRSSVAANHSIYAFCLKSVHTNLGRKRTSGRVRHSTQIPRCQPFRCRIIRCRCLSRAPRAPPHAPEPGCHGAQRKAGPGVRRREEETRVPHATGTCMLSNSDLFAVFTASEPCVHHHRRQRRGAADRHQVFIGIAIEIGGAQPQGTGRRAQRHWISEQS
jgi:hypothetical protein